MSVKNAIIKVVLSNFIMLLSSVFIGFILPSKLSLNDYSLFKTYTFYAGFIGIFHLGYVDGIGIRYVLCTDKKHSLKELPCDRFTFVIFQVIISSIVCIWAIVSKNILILLIGFSIVPYNLSTFHKRLFQALGEFSKYSLNTYIYSIVVLLFVFSGVYIWKCSSYVMYCIAYIIANLLSAMIMEINYYKKYCKDRGKLKKASFVNIKTGFLIMLGNLTANLFFSLDRWFVKIFYSNNDFAYYSFAISMINVVVCIINAIGIPFYNFLVTKFDKKKYQDIEVILMILGIYASVFYFPLSYIVKTFIPHYILSLKIIEFSFLVFPFMLPINVLYINLYKIEDMSKKYVTRIIFQIILSICLNLVTLYWADMKWLALVTTISYAIWFILCKRDFTYIKRSRKQFLYIICYCIVFILLINLKSFVLASVLYLLSITFMTLVAYGRKIRYYMELLSL